MSIPSPAMWAAVAAISVAAAVFLHFRLQIRTLRVPRAPWAHFAGVALSVSLATAACVMGTGSVETGLAVVALLASAFFVVFNSTSRLPANRPTIEVGMPAIDFEATASDGAKFRLSSLRGQRILLKFDRGYWCAFCDAELQELERFRRVLLLDGIHLVAVTPDTVTESARMKRKRRLGFPVVSDETLGVAGLYNLGYRGFTPVRGPMRELFIPTTVLIDEDFVVRWIDQAEDFRLRTDINTVLETLRGKLRRRGPPNVTPPAYA